MSEQSREAIKKVSEHLEQADSHLGAGEAFSEQAGDKGLSKRIQKVRKEVAEVKKEIGEKMNPEKA
jgi:hypothetical protein